MRKYLICICVLASMLLISCWDRSGLDNNVEDNTSIWHQDNSGNIVFDNGIYIDQEGVVSFDNGYFSWYIDENGSIVSEDWFITKYGEFLYIEEPVVDEPVADYGEDDAVEHLEDDAVDDDYIEPEENDVDID